MKKIIFSLLLFFLVSPVFAATRTIANGGGNWSATGTWVEGAVPTSADAVVATATSGNVTIDAAAAAQSVDFTNYVGTLTHNSGITLTVSGSLTLVSGMTYSPADDTAAITINGTGTITTAGKSLGNFTVSGSGITVTLADNLNTRAITTTVTLTQGTLKTDGASDTSALTHSWGRFNSSNSNTRTLTLGASNINLVASSGVGGGGAWTVATSTNLTLNANTSTITLNYNNATFSGGGKTYNTVRFISSSQASILQANTFATLTRTGTAGKTDSLLVQPNQTVTGTLNLNGNSTTNRILVQSNTLGTAATFTLTGATVSASNVDFRDITMTPAQNLSAITGNSGDCGGNSGITFTTAATQYWFKDTGNWSTAGQWFLATNGGGGAGRVPLPQDDVVFDVNSFSAVSKTVTQDMPRIGKSINWTGATNSPTWTVSTALTIYGSLTLISGMTFTNSVSWTFEGRGSFTLTMAGKNFNSSVPTITISMFGGTLTLQDAYSQTTGTLVLNNGTLNTNNFNVTLNAFSSNVSTARTLTMGSETWTISGAPNFWLVTSTLTLNRGTSTISMTNTGSGVKTFTGGGLTYYNLSLTGGGTGAVTIAGSNTFNTFTINAPLTVTFTSGTTQTVSSFVATGTSGNVITINSSTSGTAATLSRSSGTVSCDYLSLKDSAATGGAKWYAGANSTNVSGNSGWIFTAPFDGLLIGGD